MKWGLDDKVIQELINEFKKVPQVDEVILYGSRVKGTFREGSDIDLTLKGNELNLAILSRIETQLDQLMLPYKIDISLFSNLQNVDLIDHITRVGVVLYKKN
ncbi:MAG: nucleotidyltransferase domain-containing protein [Pseudobdellovibrionaceae bacterium]